MLLAVASVHLQSIEWRELHKHTQATLQIYDQALSSIPGAT